MFFILPLGQHSLVGTTDTEYHGDLDEVHANRDDVEYLLNETRRVLPGVDISREKILYTYAGIRPLAFAGSSESKISRKHRIIREGRSGRIVTIAGGKLTTYRAMAKDVMDAVCSVLKLRRRCCTDTKAFPGGLPVSYDEYMKEAVPELGSRYRVDRETVLHLVRLYGSRTGRVLELVKDDPALREQISPESRDIHAQAVYGIREELARTLPDIVLRRMHLGMTGTRGSDRIDRIAAVAARELGWNDEETRFEVERFQKELQKETACLR